MILLLILAALTVVALIATVFLLGFRLGGEHWQSDLTRVRLDAAAAQRRLFELNRAAFVSMAEAVERHRQSP
jgi:hypothetical protein